MLTRITLLGAAALFSLTACTGVNVRMPKDGVQLIEKSVGEDGTVTYRLLPGRDGPPTIQRTEKSAREKASFKMNVSSLSGDLADSLGVPAWEGVQVHHVPDGSSAARAGIVNGDIVTAMNGTKLVGKAQYEELLAANLAPGRPITLELSRRSEAQGEADWQSLTVEVVPDSKKVTETKTDSFKLETSTGIQQVTGLQIATVPPDLAAEIYGTSQPVTVVSGVLSGSPGYMAGFRGGDRVVACDGMEGVDLSSVRDVVRAHAAGSGFATSVFEMPDAATAKPGDVGERSGDVTLSVLGPLGAHEASVEVVDDIEESNRFFFPVLFSYNSTVTNTKWSFLNFIFQFGANYDSKYERSLSRNPVEQTSLSLFPLGMFEFETGPTRNHYTFFWLIEWSTRG